MSENGNDDDAPPSDDGGASSSSAPLGEDAFTGPGWRGATGRRVPGERTAEFRRRRRRRRLLRRAFLASLIGAGVLLVVAVGWVAVTALLARSQLNQVRAGITQLRSAVSDGRVDDARVLATDLGKRTARAHSLTSGPAWWAGAGVPLLGEPLESMRSVTSAGDVLGRKTLPSLINVADDLDPAKLRTAGNRIDVERLTAAAPALRSAVGTIETARDNVRSSPSHTWLSPVDHGRKLLLGQLTDLTGTLRSADRAAQVLPVMLGANRPMRYFVGLQNEAEARGTGGIPGSFAIVEATDGKLAITHIGPDTELKTVSVPADFGPDYAALYGSDKPGSFIANSNISPNFPYAARIWAAVWQKKSGQHVDGAIALDPTALSYFLRVTGPARMADGTPVTAGNVVALTQQQAYDKYTDSDQRKAYLVDVAHAAEAKLLSGSGSPSKLVRAAQHAASERRLLVWSADPHTQALLAQTSLAGALPETTSAYAGLVVINSGANKLDYYLDRTVSWQRSICNPHDVTVTITLHNGAPAKLPAYVTLRTDQHSYPTKPGDSRLLVQWFATAGTTLTKLTVDDKPGLVQGGSELGHPVFVTDLELPRGESRTLVLHLNDPSTGNPERMTQPLVRPLKMSVTHSDCAY